MMFFGHVGITTALVKSIDDNLDSFDSIDYRFVLAGSILPDLIDKPLAVVFLVGHAQSFRFFAHTLIFSVILVIIGIGCYIIKNRNNILMLGICSLIHTILDLSWVFPKIYFYPFLGLRFPMDTSYKFVPNYAKLYFSHFSYFIFEVIGIILLYYFLKKAKSYKSIKSFIKNGKIFN
ncbi:metal-dependent hydrolase [Clostridium folliculivorans]|uniref:metal-dependent hydrolase n=1 Tax=Clostridium folliculivorans TaxID=2886038 RepID=UPI0021C2AD32|nr:metal-dependent hydrolase [Clostridium folliculivorans]GKU31651.1 hydrolase [Clostridium folliculivorans]